MNKIALVTGGNRGIGFEVVKQLCGLKILTIFTSRNPHDGLMAIDKLKAHKHFLDYHPLDVSDNASVAALLKFISGKHKKLDILINNAATNYDSWQTVSAVSMTQVEYTFNVNFFGPWRMCIAFLPLLRESSDARIINVSSGSGTLASLNGSTPAYSLSKNCLNMLTKSLASDLKAAPITVNSVCPGWTRTDMGGPDAPRSIPKGAETIVWLATQKDNTRSGRFFRDKKVIPW